jgi:hypothetical protein
MATRIRWPIIDIATFVADARNSLGSCPFLFSRISRSFDTILPGSDRLHNAEHSSLAHCMPAPLE